MGEFHFFDPLRGPRALNRRYPFKGSRALNPIYPFLNPKPKTQPYMGSGKVPGL